MKNFLKFKSSMLKFVFLNWFATSWAIASTPVIHSAQEIVDNPELAYSILESGWAIVEGKLGTKVRRNHKKIAKILKEKSSPVHKVPLAIGGNPIRGLLPFTKEGQRTGLYYGPTVAPYLGKDAAPFNLAYYELLQTTDEIIKALFTVIKKDLSKLRSNSGLKSFQGSDLSDKYHVDTLTAAYYESSDAISLGAHEDFGLATLGMADAEGLEYLDAKGSWATMPASLVLFHVGKWLRLFLKNEGIKCSPFIHRVGKSPSKRIFVGMFYEPNRDTMMRANFFGKGEESYSYADFIQASFRSHYKGEHPDVDLTGKNSTALKLKAKL